MNKQIEEFLFDDATEEQAYRAGGKVDKIRVGHDYFDAAIHGVKECMKESYVSREPVNCMLLGEGGTGKTSIAEMFISWMKPEVIIENDMEISTVPVFYTSFKTARTLEALTEDMLKKLGDPHPREGKVAQKAARVLELLKRCRTLIVFIDELHDLDNITVRGSKEWYQFIKWLKEISNECGPMICLMGTSACKGIFKGDNEMLRRFKHELMLRRLSPGTSEEPGLLQSFLVDMCQEIEKRTQIEGFPPVGEYLEALRIYAATKGNLDFIATLLKLSVIKTLLDGRKVVEIRDFAAVWEGGALNKMSLTSFNPFLASQAQIAAVIRKKSS